MQLEVSHAIYIGKAMSFSFKQFHIDDAHCAMKVGTDGVLLGAWANVCEADRILDVGCGCGLIALMAAQRNRAARVVGVELDAAAVADALANVQHSPFASNVEIVCADVLQYAADCGLAFDSILSNSPYHEESLLPPASQRAKARHTQGGGLTFAALLRVVEHLLNPANPKATFSAILPLSAVAGFVAMAAVHGLQLMRRTDVVTRKGRPCKRVLLEFCRTPQSLVHTTLSLVGDDGARAEAYADLCKDFYL